MPQFSDISKFRLSTCHPDLVTLFNIVIQYVDCTVLQGYRGQKEQEEAFSKGNTKLHYPNSKHNSKPSLAADVAICFNGKVDYSKKDNFLYFGGFVLGVAEMLRLQGKMQHKIRWGNDWKMDNNPADNVFADSCHFEIIS